MGQNCIDFEKFELFKMIFDVVILDVFDHLEVFGGGVYA